MPYTQIPFRIFITVSLKVFLLKRPTRLSIQSLSCNVRLCVCVTFSLSYFWANPPNAKRILTEKLRQDIGVRFSVFCLEMVENYHAEKSVFFGLCHPFAWTHNRIIMDAQRNKHGQTTELAGTHNCLLIGHNKTYKCYFVVPSVLLRPKLDGSRSITAAASYCA